MGGPDRQVPRQLSKATGQPMAVLSTMAEKPVAAMDVLSLRSGYMAIYRFRLWVADFTLSRTSNLSTARSRQKPDPGASRVPFFATRRIIEGLGLGLARRAARKLVPVVLTLGSGPSGFPRKLSRRRPKLPRQPWQTRAVVCARSVIAALGAGPSGFPKQLRGDGQSFRDSHGKPAPSFARAPFFWGWGLARRASRNNLPGDGQSICDSVPRVRFRRFSAGEWPDGLPETSFRAMQASATAMANPRRRSRALRYCGAGGWPVGLPETIFGATSLVAGRASRNKFPSDAKRGDLGRRRGACGPKPMLQHGPGLSRARTRAVAAMAVLSTSGQMARSLDSGCGWPISYCPV